MIKGIIVWSCILIPSVIIGAILGFFTKSKLGVVLAGGIPWMGLLGTLLYYEYFAPYQGGGASMWPIAQLFAGTIMAGLEIEICILCRNIKKKTLTNRSS